MKCNCGHDMEWTDAMEPEADTNTHGCPPMWYCHDCGNEESDYRNYDEYVQVQREERIESNLGYTI